MKLTTNQSLEVTVKNVEVYSSSVQVSFEATMGNRTFVFSTTTEDVYNVNAYGEFVGHICDIIQIDPFGVFFESNTDFINKLFTEIITAYKAAISVDEEVEVEASNELTDADESKLVQVIATVLATESTVTVFKDTKKEMTFSMENGELVRYVKLFDVAYNMARLQDRPVEKIARLVTASFNKDIA